MAADKHIEDATRTYESFVGLMKWGTLAVICVAAIVILLISS
jgi:hypothetical protein